jgi:hypothetical protein
MDTNELIRVRQKLLQDLGENTALLQQAKRPEYDNRRVAYDGAVFVLVITFTDGSVNRTEWTSGRERWMHEHSVRRMFGNKIQGVVNTIGIKGKIDWGKVAEKHSWAHMHDDADVPLEVSENVERCSVWYD